MHGKNTAREEGKGLLREKTSRVPGRSVLGPVASCVFMDDLQEVWREQTRFANGTELFGVTE